MSTLRSTQDDRGAAAVEFALVFALVLGPLLYAIVAFGFVLYQQATVTQLARVAARSAAICSGGAGATAAACDAAGQAALTRYSPPGFSGYLAGTSGANSSECFGAGGSATAIVQANLVLPMVGLSQVTGRSATPCGG